MLIDILSLEGVISERKNFASAGAKNFFQELAPFQRATLSRKSKQEFVQVDTTLFLEKRQVAFHRAVGFIRIFIVKILVELLPLKVYPFILTHTATHL